MEVMENLGQGFADVATGTMDYATSDLLFDWLPADIGAVVIVVLIILLIVAIKRAVLV